MRKLQVAILGLLVVAVGQADQISIGLPNISGTGCSKNTVAMALSPDAGQLSLLFNAYTVEARGTDRMDTKNCVIRLPIHVPKDVSISIFQMDFRGYTSLPKNARSVLDVDHDFFGNQGPKTQEVFDGERDGEFLVSHKLATDKHIWSKCGEDVDLRVRSSIRVKTNKKGDQAIATVDSVDVYSSGMVYRLQMKKCQKKGRS